MVCRWAALAVVGSLALTGCDDWMMGGVPRTGVPGTGAPETAWPESRRSRYETATVTVRAATPLRVAAAAGSHAEIAAITVTVAGDDAEGVAQDPLAETDLTKSESGWSGSLSELTMDTALTFTAAALSAEDVLLFAGNTTVTLGDDTDTVIIGLASVGGGGGATRIPVITAITVGEVVTDGLATVQVAVAGSGSEQLDFEFSGGSFTPAADSVTLANGAGTISSTYTAPASPGSYAAQVRVTNAQRHGVEVDFEITVGAAAASQSGPITLNANLGPVVTSLAGKRTPAGVRWTAAVSTQHDAAATFAWSFTGAGSFTDAAANPTILTGYDESTVGTLQVTVTDAAGLATTASLDVAAGMFPDSLVRGAAELVINEIDYDQASTDANEFIEIHNPGTDAVDLADYRIELVNGSDGVPYESYTATGELAGGGFYLIADQNVIDTVPGVTSQALKSSGLQNGPDAIRIVETSTGRVVDGVHYGGPVAGAGEGATALKDPATASTSIGRCPNGFDSNDNGLDFIAMSATPGAANTCS